MKLSITAILSFLALDASLASAKPVLSQEVRDALIRSPRLPDPTANRITLVGLDLGKEPLNATESAFLEDTIRKVFDEVHEDMGLDLYAESVSLGNNWTPSNETDTNETEPSRNLRGRGLYIRDKPHVTNKPPREDDDDWYDRYGDDRWEYDCDWNVVVRCSWMCGLDDDVPVYPTRAPVRNWLVHQFGDDDWKGPKPDINFRFTLTPTDSTTESPSMVPTTQKVVLEEERGPEEPTFEEELLKKLKRSRHVRFNKLRKIRFGHWGQ